MKHTLSCEDDQTHGARCTCDAEVSERPRDIQPRPAVMAFARLMEVRLRANDHKGGWQLEHPRYLLQRLNEETAELVALGVPRMTACALRHAERPSSPTHCAPDTPLVGHESADVANFAMMLADICGALTAYSNEGADR